MEYPETSLEKTVSYGKHPFVTYFLLSEWYLVSEFIM